MLASALAVSTSVEADTCATMGATQFVDAVTYCATSVLPGQAGNDYGPENLFDGNPDSAWCEGVDGVGVGEVITLSFGGSPPFSRLIFMNGYGKSETAYFNNARPRRIEIVTDTALREVVQLPDHPLESHVDLARLLNHRHVQITILDVYPGSKFSDTCLGYVGADFEWSEELDQTMPPATPAPDAVPRAPEHILDLPDS